MGVGVWAALTAATGDGWWIGAFAGFGAVVAAALAALCDRTRHRLPGRAYVPISCWLAERLRRWTGRASSR